MSFQEKIIFKEEIHKIETIGLLAILPFCLIMTMLKTNYCTEYIHVFIPLLEKFGAEQVRLFSPCHVFHSNISKMAIYNTTECLY